MEVVQKLDLKSSEAKEYNSEDEAHEKKGLSENSTVYLSKNTVEDAGLDARLLSEPPQNEGSEADQVDSFGCCSCFSFINFFKGRLFRKYEEETAENQATITTSSILPMPAWIHTSQAEMDSQVFCHTSEAKMEYFESWERSEAKMVYYDHILEDDFMNEAKKSVMHVPLPKRC